MHVDFTITIGNLIAYGMLLGIVWRVEVISGRFMLEHELLVRDYCKRNNVKLDELPTRINVGIFSIKRGG